MPRRKRRMKGEVPAWDWIKDKFGKLNSALKSGKYISRGAAALAPLAGSYSGAIGNIGKVAALAGYGKRKRKRGRPKKNNPTFLS